MVDKGAVPSGAIYFNFEHAKKMVLERDPQTIARNAGIAFDGSCFSFVSLGIKIKVTYPDCIVTFADTGETPKLEWRFPILHYLAIADGFSLSGDVVPFRHIENFEVHPEHFEDDTGALLSKYFDDKPADKLVEACKALGAEILEGNADLFVRFDIMPKFSVFFKLWYSDDEIPGSGKFLFDKLCKHYVHDMDIHIAGPQLARFVIKQYEELRRSECQN
jgi:hypothetical protein